MPLERFAQRVTLWTGSTAGFYIALAIIIIWGITGPVFHFSDTWQLVINTSTTIITFLMVFLIQRSQNRDIAIIQVKLNELIKANVEASNKIIILERLSEDEIQKIARAQAQSVSCNPSRSP
jgi:low affinity Fe/Cu permease